MLFICLFTFIEDDITLQLLVKVVVDDIVEKVAVALAVVLQLHPQQGQGGDLQKGNFETDLSLVVTTPSARRSPSGRSLC